PRVSRSRSRPRPPRRRPFRGTDAGSGSSRRAPGRRAGRGWAPGKTGPEDGPRAPRGSVAAGPGRVDPPGRAEAAAGRGLSFALTPLRPARSKAVPGQDEKGHPADTVARMFTVNPERVEDRAEGFARLRLEYLAEPQAPGARSGGPGPATT